MRKRFSFSGCKSNENLPLREDIILKILENVNNNDKIISTGGEGGMIATNNKKLYLKIWSLKEIGKDFIKSHNKKIGFNWCHDYFGTNLRMTEIQAALGIIQLKKLSNTIKKRNLINFSIWNSLKIFKSINIPKVNTDITLAPYRTYIYLNFKFIKFMFSVRIYV